MKLRNKLFFILMISIGFFIISNYKVSAYFDYDTFELNTSIDGHNFSYTLPNSSNYDISEYDYFFIVNSSRNYANLFFYPKSCSFSIELVDGALHCYTDNDFRSYFVDLNISFNSTSDFYYVTSTYNLKAGGYSPNTSQSWYIAPNMSPFDSTSFIEGSNSSNPILSGGLVFQQPEPVQTEIPAIQEVTQVTQPILQALKVIIPVALVIMGVLIVVHLVPKMIHKVGGF